ncbi:MAG: hypothetical protein ACHREM_28940, partial [Polyangiales bacterium]
VLPAGEQVRVLRVERSDECAGGLALIAEATYPTGSRTTARTDFCPGVGEVRQDVIVVTKRGTRVRAIQDQYVDLP